MFLIPHSEPLRSSSPPLFIWLSAISHSSDFFAISHLPYAICHTLFFLGHQPFAISPSTRLGLRSLDPACDELSRGGLTELVPVERIERAILLIRGHKVMLDADLAELYRVTTFNLNKAVKRNISRFPQRRLSL